MPGEGRGGSILPPAFTLIRPLPVPKLLLSVCVPFLVGTHSSSPPGWGRRRSSLQVPTSESPPWEISWLFCWLQVLGCCYI